MPPEEFINTFLPIISAIGDRSMPQTNDAFKNVPSDPVNEDEIYEVLVGFL